MKPLYLFKLYEDEGLLKRYEIREWVYGNNSYCYAFAGSTSKTAEHNLDKYISGKVVTFNPDYARAKSIIAGTLRLKHIRAYDDMKRYESILNRMKNNPKNKEE